MIAAKYQMHGRDWEGDDPAGWIVTEKLNGVRCYWDGFNAWSKTGERITIPQRIAGRLPHTPLDGELYAGRRNFEVARCAVQYGRWTREVQFVAFDKPDVAGGILVRLSEAQRVWPQCVTARVCESYADLMDNLRDVQAHDGEGLMIHSPRQTRYTPGRTSDLLKVKLVLPLLSVRRCQRRAVRFTNPETVMKATRNHNNKTERSV